jgi:hypothetical protein
MPWPVNARSCEAPEKAAHATTQSARPGLRWVTLSWLAMSDLITRSWRGTPIARRATDGYVNATAMCKANGKRWTKYRESDRANGYLEALSTEARISVHALVESRSGGTDGGGTWVHPKVAVDLARWISPDFAVWMDGFLIDAFEDPAKAVQELSKNLSDEENEWLEARLNAKRTRHTFTDQLKQFGVVRDGYGRCTNAIYQPILGTDAKTLKVQVAQKKSLPVKSVNPRDHMTIKELNDVELAERVAVGQLHLHEASGNNEAERIVRKSSEYTRKLLDGEIKIPGL